MEDRLKNVVDEISRKFSVLKVDLDKYPDVFTVIHDKGGYVLQVDMEVLNARIKERKEGYSLIGGSKAYFVGPVDFD